MGHVYPQEREAERLCRLDSDSRLKGYCLRGEERLRDIDVGRKKRDEERQFRMERGLLALKGEAADEAEE